LTVLIQSKQWLHFNTLIKTNRY